MNRVLSKRWTSAGQAPVKVRLSDAAKDQDHQWFVRIPLRFEQVCACQLIYQSSVMAAIKAGSRNPDDRREPSRFVSTHVPASPFPVKTHSLFACRKRKRASCRVVYRGLQRVDLPHLKRVELELLHFSPNPTVLAPCIAVGLLSREAALTLD